MKKLFLLLLLLVTSLGAGAFEYRDSVSKISIEIPDDYQLVQSGTPDNSFRASYFKKGTGFIQIFFFEVKNIDKTKAKKVGDNHFFNIGELQAIESTEDLDGCYRAVTYFDPSDKVYMKFYKNVHFDGVSYVKVTCPNKDFSVFDGVVGTFSRSQAVWIYILTVITLLISAFAAWLSGNSFRESEFLRGVILLAVGLLGVFVLTYFLGYIWWICAIGFAIVFVLGLLDLEMDD